MIKKLIYICICLMILCSCSSSTSDSNKDVDVMDKISSSPAVKLEYSGDDEAIFIDNSLTQIHQLSSLNIEPAEGSFEDDWIYRFTYDPEEKVIDGQETVAVFGENSMAIDDRIYVPSDGVEYESILEWAAMTYDYYSGQ